MARPREYNEKMTEDIHLVCTPAQKAIYDSWGKDKNKVLREYITMRALGKDETERRIAEIENTEAELKKEKDRLQATLEDVISPLQDKANVIVQRYFEDGIFNLNQGMQRARIDGWAGQDDTLAAMVWDIIRERGGWGGD